MNPEYLVSVRLMTYNNEPFIRDAMDGIIMQNTNFKVEVVVGDDFSDDNTLNIIREYKNTENIDIRILERRYGDEYWQKRKALGRLYNFINIIENCTGKYIALLDGDDYWTDPYKLQKQVDFLEANPAYGLVYTNYQKLIEKTSKLYKVNCERDINDGEIYYEYLVSSFLGTCTVMARRDLILEYISKFKEKIYEWSMGDRPLFLYISSKNKCGFLSDYTAIYRRNGSSISSFNDVYDEIDFFNKSYKIRNYYIKNLRDVPQNVIDKMTISLNRELLRYYFRANDKVESKSCYETLKDLNKIAFEDYINYLGTRNYLFRKVSKIYFLINEYKKNIKRFIKSL